MNPEPIDSAVPSAHRHDRGFSLTEVVIAIALTGILVLTVIAAGWTLIRVSKVSEDQAALEAVLGAAADELSQFGWQSCPVETGSYLAEVQKAASRVEWDPSSVSISRIEYWDIGSEQWINDNPFVDSATGDCTAIPTTAAASRMQRVTISGTSPGGTQTRRLQVVVAEIRFLDEQESI
jgi:prepilin-type N-terminal cleavage/methylation domain-containing protein